MDSSVAKELQALTHKVEALAAQRDNALDRLKEANEEIADLRHQLDKALQDLHRKDLDVEFLTLSHKLADTPQALADARATVKGMIARVDKAIALLKEDARI